jgi:hypothetical protein
MVLRSAKPCLPAGRQNELTFCTKRFARLLTQSKLFYTLLDF